MSSCLAMLVQKRVLTRYQPYFVERRVDRLNMMKFVKSPLVRSYLHAYHQQQAMRNLTDWTHQMEGSRSGKVAHISRHSISRPEAEYSGKCSTCALTSSHGQFGEPSRRSLSPIALAVNLYEQASHNMSLITTNSNSA